MIVENQYLEEFQQIWEENNSGYITQESNNILLNNDKILKIVYLSGKLLLEKNLWEEESPKSS